MIPQSKFIPSITVITPVFNDWACLPLLAAGLETIKATVDIVHLLIIDDGSTESPRLRSSDYPEWIESIEIIRLGCNLGHQRAIAIGLSEAVKRSLSEAILVIDSDGEDGPDEARSLVEQFRLHPNSVVVAQRKERSEGFKFQFSYHTFKLLFHVLTGRQLDFGNFSVFSLASAGRLVFMPELWNHFPATLIKSRLPIIKIPLNRRKRFHGNSKMTYVPLINHGLAAVSVLVDIAFARLLLFSSLLTGLLIILVILITLIRYSTPLAIPGWATTASGLTLVGLLQVLAMVAVVTFLALSNRSSLSLPTISLAPSYIAKVVVVRPPR